jgi:hypothetical protein
VPLAVLLLALSQSTTPLADAVRASLEPEFRKLTGFGYRSFTCAPPPAPVGFLDCDAIDEEGDALHYTLSVDAAGEAKVVLISQPSTSLAAEHRAQLDPPCRAFLEAYGKKDWGAVYATLHPALQEKLGRDGPKTMLEPVRAALGAQRSAELRRHALRVPDLRELEYTLAGASGPGVARFRLADAPGGVRIIAFSVSPEAGSAAQSALLEPALRDRLASLVGAPVQGLRAPLERLRQPGHAVPGTAVLAGGRELMIEARQKGRRDDFDMDDYTVEVTDVPYLVERYLRGSGVEGAAVTCPHRVLADGTAQTCRARVPAGQRTITVSRRDGQFRVTEDAAPAR